MCSAGNREKGVGLGTDSSDNVVNTLLIFCFFRVCNISNIEFTCHVSLQDLFSHSAASIACLKWLS